MMNTLERNNRTKSIKRSVTSNRSDNRTCYRRSNRRSNRGIINNGIFKISFLCAVVFFACLAAFIDVSASNSIENVNKQYKSIAIDDGDTLWSIATEFNNQTLSGISNKEYVKDIVDINNISEDNITAGNFILVPIYVAEK